MKLTDLRKNQQYLFHYKDINNPVFRANFVKLVSIGNIHTLIVNNYHSEKNPREHTETLWSIDGDMISNIESTQNILGRMAAYLCY